MHPTNPDVVWVSALGALWGSNPERGLHKTTDGGRTWTLSKFTWLGSGARRRCAWWLYRRGWCR